MKEKLKSIFLENVTKMHEYYDEELKLMKFFLKSKGYHTKTNGEKHPILPSIKYALAIFVSNDTTYYTRAEDLINRVVSLQNTDENSKTYGLWSYTYEEPLDMMLAPDYNWAAFVGKYLIQIIRMHSDKVSQNTVMNMKQSLAKALICIKSRNIAADYTNISIMSAFVLIAGSEILQDKVTLAWGKERLKNFYEYTHFTSAFSEYNSSCYTMIAIEEINRMLHFFEDEECIQMANELYKYAWSCVANHYHTGLKQLTPPQARSYKNLDIPEEQPDFLAENSGTVGAIIYIGTNGEYGQLDNYYEANIFWLISNIECPAAEKKLFMGNNRERWIEEVYYKKNDLRKIGEETVIVKDLDSSDLIAYSYLSRQYCLGAFQKTDLWTQRRSSMVYWGDGENVAYLRLRCIKDNYDFSSGMVYTAQYKDAMLSAIGLVNDHGDFHYILDNIKNHSIKAYQLLYRFELGGNLENVSIQRNDNVFFIKDNDFMIKIDIKSALFDGKPVQIELTDEGSKKYIDIVLYRGQEKEIYLNQLKETYGIFALAVDDKNETINIMLSKEKSVIQAKMNYQGVELIVTAPSSVTSYRSAIENTICAYKTNEKVS